jgi:hypothetical protein
MMKLEQFTVGRDVVCQRIIPATRIPPPVYRRVIQPVADVWHVSQLARISVVNQKRSDLRISGSLMFYPIN